MFLEKNKLNNLWKIELKLLENNSDLNDLKISGTYISPYWENKIINKPLEASNAFYLIVFSHSNSYACQLLIDYYGKIFFRNISSKEDTFSNWRILF